MAALLHDVGHTAYSHEAEAILQKKIGSHEEIGKHMTLKGELIALGKSLMSSKDIHSAGKGLAVKTDKVFMPAGTYPKMQKV